MMMYAHVDAEDMGKSDVKFHLNFRYGELILRPPFTVFATANNGRTGEIYSVTGICGFTRIRVPGDTSFVSVDYVASPRKWRK